MGAHEQIPDFIDPLFELETKIRVGSPNARVFEVTDGCSEEIRQNLTRAGMKCVIIKDPGEEDIITIVQVDPTTPAARVLGVISNCETRGLLVHGSHHQALKDIPSGQFFDTYAKFLTD